MKMSRRERKSYNLGKQVGYADGYSKGLHDGNPFNQIIETMNQIVNTFADAMKDPEFAEAVKDYNEHPELVELVDLEED